jgi:hypothetical protein
VITGFNSDVEHEGVVYHVQTEDKGLESPLILSLVYAGGAILASKRSPYEDLFAAGFNEQVLAERLKRQHRLICAAIRAGRLDDLKRMGTRELDPAAAQAQSSSSLAGQIERGERPNTEEVAPEITPAEAIKQHSPPVEAPSPPVSQAEAYSIYDPRRQAPVELSGSTDGLRVTLLDEQNFQAGDSLLVRILVSFRSKGDEKPKAGVPVSVKVLGTAFRPQVYSVKTERDGIAVVSIQIPQFTSGRAAILVRTVADGDTVEIRRVIQPAQQIH